VTVDASLREQVRALEEMLRTNPVIADLLRRVPQLGLPGWYLGAGCVSGTVWSVLHGFDPGRGVKDYDVVYFDPADLSAEAEARTEHAVTELVREHGIEVDVTNEARVHTWYGERFGRAIDPYTSVEHAISTWPTTASSVGVRSDETGFVVCAPYGLRDLLAMVVRPNKAIVDRGVYEAKAARWAATWPRLVVLPW
jgi:hypothetical protein